MGNCSQMCHCSPLTLSGVVQELMKSSKKGKLPIVNEKGELVCTLSSYLFLPSLAYCPVPVFGQAIVMSQYTVVCRGHVLQHPQVALISRTDLLKNRDYP